MNFFSIRDVQNLTGIKAHTLRIWEQRHSILNARRKRSNHRFYDNEDLKQLLRISFLYHHGYKISRIAGLSEEDISRLALEIKPDRENHDIYINRLLEATIDLDFERFENTLDCLVHQTGFENGVLEVLFPLLRKIGHLWMAGNVMPAQEHFASALIIKKILAATDKLNRPAVTKPQRRVLIYTPYGELHEIPILFMQYMLRKNGIPYLYLGSNVKTETLKAACTQYEKFNPDQPITQIYFYLITNLIKCDLGEYLHRLSGLFPGKEIVYAGGKTGTYISRGIPPNVRLLRGRSDLTAFSSSR